MRNHTVSFVMRLWSILVLLQIITLSAAAKNYYKEHHIAAPLVPSAETESTISDEYVVVFKRHASHYHVRKHLAVVLSAHDQRMTSFHIGSMRGYSARLNEFSLRTVRRMSEVAFVERNQVVSVFHDTSCLVQERATWGLVRTTTKNMPLSNDYPFNKNKQGAGVKVYVIDSGIDISHPEFEGRAVMGKDFIAEQFSGGRTHIHGHGTHVAGTIGSKTYGLAKKTTLVDVRVLNTAGKGSLLTVLSGLNWVVRNHRKGKSLVNMSVGSKRSVVLNMAVDEAVKLGIPVVTSAGNNGKSACSKSPASAKKSVTVAASDKNDRFLSASNHGNCVDIIAPGVRILSTWTRNRLALATGTSMAAPHVTGVMAKMLSNEHFTPEQLKGKLLKEATQNKISFVPSGTPNLLVFNECK